MIQAPTPADHNPMPGYFARHRIANDIALKQSGIGPILHELRFVPVEEYDPQGIFDFRKQLRGYVAQFADSVAKDPYLFQSPETIDQLTPQQQENRRDWRAMLQKEWAELHALVQRYHEDFPNTSELPDKSDFMAKLPVVLTAIVSEITATKDDVSTIMNAEREHWQLSHPGQEWPYDVAEREKNNVPQADDETPAKHAKDAPQSAAPLSSAYVSQWPGMTQPPAAADTGATPTEDRESSEDEPPTTEMKETLETLHYRREGLDETQKLMLVHQVRAAVADITLPGASMSWHAQLKNASNYRQAYMRSHEGAPKPPSFQSTLVARRQVEKALDQLADTAANHYRPGKADTAIEQQFQALMDAVDQMVGKTPNAKAALGDASLRDALACVLYSAIEQGFENTAKLLINGSHADQLQQARNQNGPSLRGH